jgi:hypothetical protein
MAVIDFSEFDPTTADSGGAPDPGKAFVRVVDIDESDDSQVEAEVEVVRHEVKGNEGRTSKLWLKTEGKGAKRAIIFAIAAGLITKQELGIAHAEGTSIDIDYSDAVAKTFFVTFEKSVWEGKERVKIEFQMVNPEDPAAAAYKEALGGKTPPAKTDKGKPSKTEPQAKPAPELSPLSDDDIPF